MTLKKTSLITFVAAIAVTGFFNACKEKKKETLFESIPASQTNISFVNKTEKHDLFSILYYLYYYNGAGVAAGDINNDGLPDLYFTANNPSGNKLYLNKGNFTFEDITAKAGVAGTADWCTGVTMADVNGDGYMDIYTSAISGSYNLKGHNQLFINKGNGTFKDESVSLGLDFAGLTTQAAFFDFDRDGDLDCYLLNQSHHPHANIVDTSKRRRFDAASGDRLYRNDISTTGKFTDVSAAAGIYQSNLGYGLGLAIGDFNNDGWDDIYVGNDFHENDYYYLNNGNGTFTESGAQHFKHYSRFSMGNDAADYNNDGQLDIVTVDMLPPDEKILKTYGSDENPDIYKLKLEMNGYQQQYSRNCLQRNNGDGASFSETGLISGVSATDWSWAPLFADFDNDGNKDLFITSGIVKRPVDLDYIRFVSDLDIKKGRQQTDAFDEVAIKSMPEGSSHPYFYKGDGKLKFSDVSESWGTGEMKGYYNGAAYADLNNDGNLDVIVNCLDAPALILKNKHPQQLSMDISFKGNNKNTFGIGAKAWLFTKGRMQYQQLMLTRGFQSSCEAKVHFGLDSTRYIDSLLIVWPDQRYQVLKNIPVVGKMTVNQAEANQGFDYKQFFPQPARHFEDVSASVNLNWAHRENPFWDYNRQYLIPHMQSTRGPRLAVADVNKDGLDDFYVCGAAGQAGQLMIQTAAGKFTSSDTAVFNKQMLSEDVDALFFDANKDGYPDLYVVSGGNHLADNNPELADHLYINNGSGHFTLQPSAIPAILKNKSCVAASDIDHDGDTDLFVGGLADAKKYGIAQPSYLLINNGSGVFNVATAQQINLNNQGIVTSAAFADLDKDGWDELLITGEWMPLRVFMNNRGTFTMKDIPASTGLWQTLSVKDVNGDGYSDILAGNWGCNNKFYAGKNGPLKLYVKDFDKNGSLEQVMCYTINGNEYTFLAKDELERSLPVLKKAYLKYSDVAGKTVQYMFDDLFKDYIELKAEVLASSVFINNGKGMFERKALPDESQLSPVFAISELSADTWLTGGNFYGVVPYEGRYDAQLPTAIRFDKASGAMKKQWQLPLIDGEIRDFKWVRMNGNNKLLVAARCNGNLVFLNPVEN